MNRDCVWKIAGKNEVEEQIKEKFMYLEISSRQSGKTARLIEQAKIFAQSVADPSEKKVVIVCHSKKSAKDIKNKLCGYLISCTKAYPMGIQHYNAPILDYIKIVSCDEVALADYPERPNAYLGYVKNLELIECYKILYDEFAFFHNNWQFPMNDDCYFYTSVNKQYSSEELKESDDFFCKVLRANDYKYASNRKDDLDMIFRIGQENYNREYGCQFIKESRKLKVQWTVEPEYKLKKTFDLTKFMDDEIKRICKLEDEKFEQEVVDELYKIYKELPVSEDIKFYPKRGIRTHYYKENWKEVRDNIDGVCEDILNSSAIGVSKVSAIGSFNIYIDRLYNGQECDVKYFYKNKIFYLKCYNMAGHQFIIANVKDAIENITSKEDIKNNVMRFNMTLPPVKERIHIDFSITREGNIINEN